MPTVYSVSQLVGYIKNVLESDGILQDVWVEGEITNHFQAASKHHYFSISDGNSLIQCVLFRFGKGSENIKKGETIIVQGRTSIYTTRGDLQIIAEMVQAGGFGSLQQELEQIKARLDAEGLFSDSRKRNLPLFPKSVAVITSPEGAVWHDIQTVTRRRYPNVELVLIPSKVQGEESLSELIHAFEIVNQNDFLDVVILARGGGSSEDLQSFNTELLARAIFTCSTPVVSAIGHETDITISDLVADVRAATPSAAAEIVMPDQDLLKEQIIRSKDHISKTILSFLEMIEGNIHGANHLLNSSVPDFDSYKLDIDSLSEKTITSLKQFLHLQNLSISNSRNQLNSLSPTNTLKRGYSVVHDSKNQIVTDPKNLVDKEQLQITLKSGSFEAIVQKPYPDK
tara:strand:- start:234 stop:1427 length:1194 start_codon:yes stop_codon:yes gene_type:complete